MVVIRCNDGMDWGVKPGTDIIFASLNVAFIDVHTNKLHQVRRASILRIFTI